MARLTNSNMTTSSTGMSKNSENLAAELAAMPKALATVNFSGNGHAVILARLVRGLSRENWEEASSEHALGQWQALPVPAAAENDEELECLQKISCRQLPVSPFREVSGALTRSMFINLLQRELLRLSRNGGSLSIISASLINRRKISEEEGEDKLLKLDALLGATLLARMDACDALGLARQGLFICSLPGIGQLGARRFAETAQSAFKDSAKSIMGQQGGESGAKCALGIINILQGEACAPADLLKRSRATLEVALRKSGGYIHQESAMAPFEGTTLVHSSEKRFLFFGGDPK
ncbi:MAG: GGDEF domain-containing protein [Desulfovibrio sp.]|nr:GGDEF domain-containing protein [Desulfovibrio sp.]